MTEETKEKEVVEFMLVHVTRENCITTFRGFDSLELAERAIVELKRVSYYPRVFAIQTKGKPII